MPDLTDTISAAVHEAETGVADATDTETDSGSGVGGVSEDTTSTTTEAAAGSDATGSGKSVVSGDKADPAKPTTTDVALDELDKELEAEGVKKHAERQDRENRIPYSRVKKILENAKKKLADSHTATMAETTGRLTKAELRAKQADVWDRLAATDDVRLLQALSAMHPDRYGKYLVPATTKTEAKVEEVMAEKPPAPDHKFEDGSVGYTAEGHQKLLDWYAARAARDAVAQAKKLVDERLDPIEKDRKKSLEVAAAREYNENVTKQINDQVARASKTWGKLFDDDYKLDDKSEVYKFMVANPGVPFDACVAAILTPKMQAGRDKMREDLLKEQEERPAAADKNLAGPGKGKSDKAGPVTLEDVIRESIAGMK